MISRIVQPIVPDLIDPHSLSRDIPLPNVLVRVEPSNKNYSLEEGMTAKLKDPLWTLGRQWQTDEFTAKDGGDPISVQVSQATVLLDSLTHANGSHESFDIDNPLESLVEQETEMSPSWSTKTLSYNFSLSSENHADSYLKSEEYDGEKLDWYNFNYTSLPTFNTQEVQYFTPYPIKYSGMPLSRWWMFEDGEINLGDLTRPYFNMITMLLIEFALVYSQDWYYIPLKHKIGSLRKITYPLIIKDNFGSKIYASPIKYSGDQNAFSLFTLSATNSLDTPDGSLFYLPNNLSHCLESKPREEVSFFRDEMANLVWGVEKLYEVNNEVINRHDSEPPKEMPKPENYWNALENQLVTSAENVDTSKTSVPTSLYLQKYSPSVYWIPYFLQKENNHFFLRRPDAVEGTEPRFRGLILKESSEIAEEEILREGVKVIRVKQLARNGTGEVVLWKSRKKRSDCRQADSQLKFDCLIES